MKYFIRFLLGLLIILSLMICTAETVKSKEPEPILILPSQPMYTFAPEPTPEPTPEPEIMIMAITPEPDRYTQAQKEIIARVVYAESRGECIEGQIAVAQTVINRLESGKFGKSLNYITRRSQFAKGKKYNDESMRAVEEAINKPYPLNMYYFQVSKSKHWRNFEYYKRIGNHSFYLG